eukprot:4092560-Karenia_brevis.AAC.1
MQRSAKAIFHALSGTSTKQLCYAQDCFVQWECRTQAAEINCHIAFRFAPKHTHPDVQKSAWKI